MGFVGSFESYLSLAPSVRPLRSHSRAYKGTRPQNRARPERGGRVAASFRRVQPGCNAVATPLQRPESVATGWRTVKGRGTRTCGIRGDRGRNWPYSLAC